MTLGNNVLSVSTSNVNTTTEKDFEYYDQLPSRLRLALQVAPRNFSAQNLHEHYRRYGEITVLRLLDMQAWREIRNFAATYKRITGSMYPFLAAEATIQQYGPRTNRRRQRWPCWINPDSMQVPNKG